LAEVLEESGDGAAAPPELLVVNKIDAMDGLARAELAAALPGAIFISARTGEGLDGLFDRVRDEVGRHDVEIFVDVPFDRGDVVSRIHADGEVRSTEHHATGTKMRIRVPAALAGELEEFTRTGG